MSLQEMKEFVATVFFTSALLTLAILFVMYKFAEITYKRAHKKECKIRNSEIVFNIDSKNKTLQEVQAERKQMIKILGGI